MHGFEYRDLLAETKAVDEKLIALHRSDECSRRLAEIPGVGPVGASLLMMKTPKPPNVQVGSRLCRLDRTHAQRPFDRRKGQIGGDYTCW